MIIDSDNGGAMVNSSKESDNMASSTMKSTNILAGIYQAVYI